MAKAEQQHCHGIALCSRAEGGDVTMLEQKGTKERISSKKRQDGNSKGVISKIGGHVATE